MYVCVSKCVRAYVRVCLCRYTYICTYSYLSVHIYLYKNKSICRYVFMFVRESTYIYWRVFMFLCVSLRIYIGV